MKVALGAIIISMLGAGQLFKYHSGGLRRITTLLGLLGCYPFEVLIYISETFYLLVTLLVLRITHSVYEV